MGDIRPKFMLAEIQMGGHVLIVLFINCASRPRSMIPEVQRVQHETFDVFHLYTATAQRARCWGPIWFR